MLSTTNAMHDGERGERENGEHGFGRSVRARDAAMERAALDLAVSSRPAAGDARSVRRAAITRAALRSALRARYALSADARETRAIGEHRARAAAVRNAESVRVARLVRGTVRVRRARRCEDARSVVADAAFGALRVASCNP